MKRKLLSLVLASMMAFTYSISGAMAKTQLDVYEKMAERQSDIIENIIGNENLNSDFQIGNSAYSTNGNDLKINIFKNADKGVSMHSKEIGEIIMHLPKEVNNTKGVLTKSGTVVYENKNSNSVVSVQALKEYQDGMCFDSVRSLITIKNNLASHKYSFNFEFPKGYRLVKDYDHNDKFDKDDCGAVFILDDEGDVVSTIDPAWAKDANGKQINTDYDIIGSTLIQNVEFNKDTAFPIIADPTQHPTKYTKYYLTKSQTYKMTIISTLPPGSGAYVDVLGFVAGTETGGVITVWTAMISIYDSAQRHKYREFYRQMSSSQYLRETYRWRWRQGGQNSGYVMEHSPKLKIVNRKGA